MKFIPKKEFEEWISAKGIGRHPHDPASDNLYLPDRFQLSRFWPYPKEGQQVESFVWSFLSAMDCESGCMLYPKKGLWVREPRVYKDGVWISDP